MTCGRRHLWAVLLALAAWPLPRSTAVAAELEWSRRPYRMVVILAVDGSGELARLLTDGLPGYWAERAAAAVGPLWELDPRVAEGAQRHQILREMDSFQDDPSSAFSFDADKLVLFGISEHADTYLLAAREFDRYTNRWGPALKRETPQHHAIPEQSFFLLQRVISPLAQLEMDDDNRTVRLLWRGAELLPDVPGALGVRPGDVFLPVLRRTNRAGEVLTKGIQPVPWTFVEIAPNTADGPLVGRVHSGIRRPLGALRRGRVEQLGIMQRTDPADTTIKLVSRAKADEPLVGYEIYRQNAGDEELTRLGLSDENGALTVRPGDSAVQLISIKNRGDLVAKLPVVPGALQQVVVPLPDDTVRVQAQTRLAALREELIDVVARRSILMARARQKMEVGDFKKAEELLAALDQLPGRLQFSQDLARERRLHRANDPQLQRRIDQLMKGTEAALEQFLDAQPIRQLQEEFRRRKLEGDGAKVEG